MTKKIKFTLVIINIIAICIAAVWMHNSKYDFEPMIVVIGLVGALITIIYPLRKNQDEHEKTTNMVQQDKITVKGDKNITISGKQTNSTITINQKSNDKN